MPYFGDKDVSCSSTLKSLAGGKLLISAIKGGLFTFFVLSLDSA
jgi:hypothetical protein